MYEPGYRCGCASVPLSPPSSSTRLLSAAEERAVVRHEQHRAVEVLQRLEQHFLRREIEVVGRLVEHEEVGRIEQHAREHEARFLAARQRADLLVDVLAGKLKRAGQIRGARRSIRAGNPARSCSSTVRSGSSRSSDCCAK